MLSNKIRIYNEISNEEAVSLSKLAGISPFLARIFLSRGISDTNYIKKFINPSLSDLHDPFLMKDMDKAVDRISDAIVKGEKILIYGDYDVDGVTSTSIMYNFLTGQNAKVDYYIPDRLDEGYGLSIGAIEKLADQGYSLIITVDCGVTAIDEVNFINSKNICVIITDHHKCKDILPKACAVINPQRPDCEYPFKYLAGVGVAYKLITALCIKLGLGDIHKNFLDLVAVGTIADVVQLTDENRSIVKNGLKKIGESPNSGLKILIDNCGMKDREISTWVISFILGPRINAAGRVGSASRAVELFTTDDEAVSKNLADILNEENKMRQDTEAEIMKQVLDVIESDIDLEKEKIIVIAGNEWQHGVIGIVASKITERFYRPCILISVENGEGKGSGRSIDGFDLYAGLDYCKDLMGKYGGHQLAAGISIKEDNIYNFRKLINQYADSVMTEQDLIPKLIIDVNIFEEDLTLSNVRDIAILEPFGAGNRSPLFEYRGFSINDIRTVGENKHLKLKLNDKGTYVDAIAFSMGSMINKLKKDDIIDVACFLEINTWNNVDKVQLCIKDIIFNNNYKMSNYYYILNKLLELEIPGPIDVTNQVLLELKEKLLKENKVEEIISDIVPVRDDLVLVYKYIKSHCQRKIRIQNIHEFTKNAVTVLNISAFKFQMCMDIFNELGIIRLERTGKYGLVISLEENKKKADIENSLIYKKLKSLSSELLGA